MSRTATRACEIQRRLRAGSGARIFGAVEAAEQRERVEKYEAEIERLRAQLVVLQARQERIPRLGAFAVLAIPAWVLWGFAWAIVTLVLTVALMVTAAYLLRTRHEDNERDIADIERDLKLLREG